MLYSQERIDDNPLIISHLPKRTRPISIKLNATYKGDFDPLYWLYRYVPKFDIVSESKVPKKMTS